MKKYLMTIMAVLTTAGFTSCSNEVDMFEPLTSEKATIDLNITNDEVMNTRADVTGEALGSWFAKVGEGDWATANTLEGKTYTPGTYTIQVGNFKSAAEAMPNNAAGAAYFTATEDVTLVKGTNTVTFNCGTAKNAKVTVDWSGTAGVSGLTMTNVAASQAANTTSTPNTPARTYTYSAGGEAYFYAGAEVTFTINYTYNNVDKTIIKKITPAAATQYAFNVSANSNGTITTLTITYDDGMSSGGTTSTEIDAATGSESTTPSNGD